MTRPPLYDVTILGGGPAGLSAALLLGRCRRRVVLCDDGKPRNAAAQHLHGFLTRDGIAPQELLRLGRAEVVRYGVEIVPARAIAACRLSGPAPFEVTVETGQVFRSRKLLLATGVVDALPDIDGFRSFYGKGVHHCPYCDAWEYSDQPLVAFGEGAPAVGLALALRTWSQQVTACTHGHPLSAHDRARLERNHLALRPQPITRLEGDQRLHRLRFQDGTTLECAAFFFNTEKVQHSSLAAGLGCAHTGRGLPHTDHKQWTEVSGLYLAGDADGDVQFAIVAAAEGATAAVAINRELQDEERGEAREPRSPGRP